MDKKTYSRELLQDESELVTYHGVPALLYSAGDRIDRDLYLLYQGSYVLFQKKNMAWNPDDTRKLREFGANELYIKTESVLEFHGFMDDKMKAILSSDSIDTGLKAQAVYTATISAAENIFKDPNSKEHARRAVSFVKHCVQYLGSEKTAFLELFGKSALHMTEHNHGLHSMAYCVALAKELGYSSETEMRSVAIGAMFHDIGKTKVDRKILDKPGKLTPDEMAAVQKHCEYGYEITESFKNLVPEISRRMILEHHEKASGAGYPHKKRGEQIHTFSKILRVCDIFDSMTAQRVYKDKTKPFDSIVEMISQTEDAEEKRLVVRFVELMKSK